ncbi:MAG: dual specificity protein phosphatase family protein [Anaerolineae bacterium]|nr:dual specificity protein phosphatase family protein [Anaerolineae bacterium]
MFGRVIGRRDGNTRVCAEVRERYVFKKPIRFVRKGFRILYHRLRDQGVWTTFVWVYGRGVSKLTGVPLLQYSRVTSQLYVGPQFNARGKRHLEANGISALVNLRIEYDDAAHGLALEHYLHLPVIDDAAPTIEQFEHGAAFIREQIAAGRSVYIHCAGGVGRAPTIAAAYLLSTGKSLGDALAMIRSARPFISITPPQMEQLHAYAAQLNRPERVA